MGEIELSKSSRARRLILTVRPSGEVRVTYPAYIPQKRALDFLEERAEWVLSTRERLAERRCDNPLHRLSEEDIERLRREAKEYLPQRVETLAQRFGFKYGRVTIRASRTKWGSCTSSCNLSLSLYIMLLPQHLQDFILLHELCHTRHHNHSESFHALLNACVAGEEKRLNKELKNYHIR